MIKRILSYNSEKDKKILSSLSKEVPVKKITSKKNQKIIEDLWDTLNENNNESVALSAVQIGEKVQICVAKWAGKKYTIINPLLTRVRGEQLYKEGCLSVPDVSFTQIKRYQKVWCSCYNENGKFVEIAEGGRLSNIIQHEIDHMNGVSKIYENKNK